MRWNSKPLIVVGLLAAASLPWAATTDEHSQHHPMKPVAAASGAAPSKSASEPMKDIHVQHILRKLELSSRVQAAVYASERGVV